jgi:hypothetical protein
MEYEYVEFVPIDKSNPSDFNKKYGWWVDYFDTNTGYLEKARKLRLSVQIKQVMNEQRILQQFQMSGSYDSKKIIRTKRLLTINEKRYMQEYYDRLILYVDPSKREAFRIFVDAATVEMIKQIHIKVDEIIPKDSFDFTRL